MRPHGRARISPRRPQAQGVCDRCGFRYPHAALKFQYDWQGPRLANLRILVCPACYDKPQEGLRTIVLPPDPMPIMNPRPEMFVSDDNPISGIGWDPADLFPVRVSQGTVFGTLTGGGGPDAVIFGAAKPFFQSATLTPSSTAEGGNMVGINWSAMAGAPNVYPAGFGPVPQAYVISKAVVSAPIDAAFLGSGTSTTIQLDGSSNGTIWTPLASATTAGARGETVTLTSPSAVFYGYHRIAVAGDGIHAAAVALIELSAASASQAQTGSELGA